MKYDLQSILEIGEKKGCAIPAFNVYNLETVLGVLNAAQETGAPVIFQMYSRLFDTQEARYVAPAIMEAIDTLKTPAAFHLDHGAGEPEVMRALRYGATGVMIDASVNPLEENIAQTRRVVELAGAVGVGVEGELGHVGTTKDEVMAAFTEVDEAVRYVDETGVTALAIMVGTAHGKYKQAPVLGIDRISEIHAATKAHLVLHGGSGVPDDQIQAAVKAGIRKVNFGTDVCCSFLDEVFKVDRSIYAVDLFMKKPIEAVKEFAISKIKLLGADTK
ncbi:class II fructose-bisphosphate aldolase [[Ruminococcus] torques]|uniref:class II fructose-bisphosphate aldolase n=1 Tax=[Ruminococcus] torques TaxID=33039 RepID=UPI0035213D32